MERSEGIRGRPSLLERLRLGLLGKAGKQSAKHYAGSDEYWNQAMAAQFDWRQRPESVQSDRPVLASGGPPTTAGALPEPSDEQDFEPVYGMTQRQLNEWLTRNPTLKAFYQKELRKLQRSPQFLLFPSSPERNRK